MSNLTEMKESEVRELVRHVEMDVLYVTGILSDRVAREGAPKYEEPKSRLPEPTVDSLELSTCFLSARK